MSTLASAAKTLFGLDQTRSGGDAFSYATLLHHMRLQDEAIKDHQWHREQVQRRDRAKYFGGCTPESWCPAECEIPCPPDCTDGEEPGMAGKALNFVNSSIVGDDALAKLARILKDDDKQADQPEPSEPEQPQPQQPIVVTQPIPGWLRTLLTLLAVLLGAILVLWAYSIFGGDPSYELIAEPFPPPTGI